MKLIYFRLVELHQNLDYFRLRGILKLNLEIRKKMESKKIIDKKALQDKKNEKWILQNPKINTRQPKDKQAENGFGT